jgi:hypothetical protein
LGLVVVLGIGLFMRLYLQSDAKSKRRLWLAVSVAILSLCFFIYLNRLPIGITVQSVWSQLFGDGVFYSFQFAPTNFFAYLRMHLGKSSPFLWLLHPLTSAGIFGLWLMCLGYGIWSKIARTRWTSIFVLAVFLAQFPILWVFYVVDARYSVYSLPIMAIGIGWLLGHIESTKFRYASLVVLALVLGLQVLSQASLYKEVISANLFHRSRAWQYEAIIKFRGLTTNDSQTPLITALPPYLVAAYAGDQMHVLPLSSHQEYLQHKMFVWGNDINYGDLASGYRQRLEQGETLYISNAYITHQQSVIQDYEKYKEVFNFELVSEGCQQACNIYRLQLK